MRRRQWKSQDGRPDNAEPLVGRRFNRGGWNERNENRPEPGRRGMQCERIVEHIYQAIPKDSTVEKIIEVLEDELKKAPQFSVCANYMKENLEEIAKKFVAQTSANEICVEVRKKMSDVRRRNFALCSRCRETIFDIYDAIESDFNEKQVLEILDKACDGIMEEAKEECVAGMTKNVESMVEGIRQNERPGLICREAGLCMRRGPIDRWRRRSGPQD